MRVEDLYLIVRELQQIAILQSNLSASIAQVDKKSNAFIHQQRAISKMLNLIRQYEQFAA